jgi:hypothetical protein
MFDYLHRLVSQRLSISMLGIEIVPEQLGRLRKPIGESGGVDRRDVEIERSWQQVGDDLAKLFRVVFGAAPERDLAVLVPCIAQVFKEGFAQPVARSNAAPWAAF